MSTTEQTTLTVRILGRDYPVTCPEDEREALLISGEYLSRRMSAMQKKGKLLGMERIAVMAALNMARELLPDVERGAPAAATDPIGERLLRIQSRIEAALERQRPGA